jgi:hypothetical protein
VVVQACGFPTTTDSSQVQPDPVQAWKHEVAIATRSCYFKADLRISESLLKGPRCAEEH